MKQIVRQLDILRELQARRYGVSVRELVDEYNVDRRTIQRDLQDLPEIGFLLNEKRRTDHRIYYQLQKDTELPLNFPSMEVAAMIFAERSGMGLVGTPFGEHLRSAIQVHEAGGGNYQTLINEALRQYIQVQDAVLEETLRKVIREKLQTLSQ